MSSFCARPDGEQYVRLRRIGAPAACAAAPAVAPPTPATRPRSASFDLIRGAYGRVVTDATWRRSVPEHLDRAVEAGQRQGAGLDFDRLATWAGQAPPRVDPHR